MQKQVVSSEETILLKLFVEDLKQSFEAEKQKYKEEQESLTKQEAICAVQPLSNAKLFSQSNSFSNINNDFNVNTSQINSLKRQICEETAPNSPKHLKLKLNEAPASSSSASSSSSSTVNLIGQKQEIKMSSYVNSESSVVNNNFVVEDSSSFFPSVDELNNEDLLLDFDDEENSREQINYCLMEKAQQRIAGNQSNNSQIAELTEFLNGANNNLDDLDLNEDELAVQSILDFWRTFDSRRVSLSSFEF